MSDDPVSLPSSLYKKAEVENVGSHLPKGFKVKEGPSIKKSSGGTAGQTPNLDAKPSPKGAPAKAGGKSGKKSAGQSVKKRVRKSKQLDEFDGDSSDEREADKRGSSRARLTRRAKTLAPMLDADSEDDMFD
jgi:hypothetical protein